MLEDDKNCMNDLLSKFDQLGFPVQISVERDQVVLTIDRHSMYDLIKGYAVSENKEHVLSIDELPKHSNAAIYPTGVIPNFDSNDINLNKACRFIELTSSDKTTSDPFNKKIPATNKKSMILKSDIRRINESDVGCYLNFESGSEIISRGFLEPYEYVRRIMSKPF